MQVYLLFMDYGDETPSLADVFTNLHDAEEVAEHMGPAASLCEWQTTDAMPQLWEELTITCQQSYASRTSRYLTGQYTVDVDGNLWKTPDPSPFDWQITERTRRCYGPPDAPKIESRLPNITNIDNHRGLISYCAPALSVNGKFDHTATRAAFAEALAALKLALETWAEYEWNWIDERGKEPARSALSVVFPASPQGQTDTYFVYQAPPKIEYDPPPLGYA